MASTPVHGALDELQSGDGALHRPLVPHQGDAVMHRIKVAAQAVGKVPPFRMEALAASSQASNALTSCSWTVRANSCASWMLVARAGSLAAISASRRSSSDVRRSFRTRRRKVRGETV